ncbi:uncharacterized protein SCHCODRAFT_02606160 [Schizophyllum commune H4-8]|uniref:uncharacterized protein n=1 Tax=Schizophyllum commune (strain H4-8 / FGSC 9210) TaxID=578458 RepID=UPI00215E8B9F|nr:uncharacterized protein SCHCODRAFT_02606160 [Schizophyllum commune H4-8]KAI5899799.1 hypothetical protein SCHCODRAFT_02606160 [Schizophyllum commune H4-8]
MSAHLWRVYPHETGPLLAEIRHPSRSETRGRVSQSLLQLGARQIDPSPSDSPHTAPPAPFSRPFGKPPPIDSLALCPSHRAPNPSPLVAPRPSPPRLSSPPSLLIPPTAEPAREQE